MQGCNAYACVSIDFLLEVATPTHVTRVQERPKPILECTFILQCYTGHEKDILLLFIYCLLVHVCHLQLEET